MSKTAIIIGAGPAGLTAAYQLLTTTDIKPIIIEASDTPGGLTKNAYLNDNIIDVGGHRFFSKDKIVNDIWQKFMPLQGEATEEEIDCDSITKLTPNGPDPKTNDNVLLMRTRMSRIYFLNKFFNYPLSINLGAVKKLGFRKTIHAGSSYLKAQLIKQKEINLENFYINRFGRYLYNIFFEGYTEKLWGRHPKDISASWGKQRVKGLSLRKAITHALTKPFHKDNQKVEGSLVGSFSYPKLGPGQMYEIMAKWCIEHGATIKYNTTVKEIKLVNNKVVGVVTSNNETLTADYYISSMPIKDLFIALGKQAPNEIYQIATNLPYRNLISVNLLLKDLLIHNKTKRKTINNRIPDTWLYVQDAKYKLGRVQILNNWSPYLVKDNKNTTLIGLEYFTQDDEDFWNKNDNEIIDIAINEAMICNLIKKEDVIASKVVRLSKAYPAYFDSYQYFNKVINYLNAIDNLYCIGRNGQHRYNNMDHSMLTAIKCIEAIQRKVDKEDIWKINTKQEYHEED